MDVQRNATIEEAVLIDLIRRAQEWGDPGAFDGIYMLYADRIYRYLLVRIGDPVMSEEIASQVFLAKEGFYFARPIHLCSNFTNQGYPRCLVSAALSWPISSNI